MLSTTASPLFAYAPRQASERFFETGSHVEPNVFDHEFCDKLIDEANTFPAVKQGNYRTALQPHMHSELFLQALRNPTVTRIVRGLLGDPISGLQTQFFYCKPGTPGFQPHQDNWFVQAPRGKFASVWLALADIGKVNGCLYVYPGTQGQPLLTVEEIAAQESMLQDTNARRLRCAVPSDFTPVDLEIPKGGAVFLHGHTVHGSHANESNRCRYALLQTYIVRGAPYVAGRYAHREEIPLD